MPLTHRMQHASNELRRHLEKFDWSGQTSGRSLILEAFLKLATTDGYSSVTMRRLAKAVNVKASSIYFHFPQGREEIVMESLRWHYYQWGMAVLAAVDDCTTGDEFWDALTAVHLKRQMSLPQSDLWDLLVSMDSIGRFLPAEFRAEIDHWLRLYADMYRAGAYEMGYRDCDDVVQAVIALLDSARSWCKWSGDESALETLAARATALTRGLLSSQDPISDSARPKSKAS